MYEKTQKTIREVIDEMEKLDELGNTAISKYVEFSLRETIERIEAYLNSQFISEDTDALGREKPFFNIVTAASNVWFRATDIDRKDIMIRPTKSKDTVNAFIATIRLQEWMRKNNFGMWLNEWGRTLARYGSAVSKFVEKDGKLTAEVVPWNRLIVDPVDFNNSVVIEKLWLTEAQLKSNDAYDQDVVKSLVANPSSRETMDGQKKDTKQDYYEVYEVHGMMPESYLTDNDEDEDLVQQVQIVSFQGTESGEPEDYTLYRGREAKHPYHIAHLIKEDGRTLAIGAVEHLFEAQWMVNHSAKQMKDQLDLASKLIFQTSDGNFVNQNVLNNIENGQILVHNVNQPLTQLSNQPNIAAMQSFAGQWEALGNRINGISEAMLGETPKSGTAWRQTEAILQESRSLFELMTENKGLALEDILREHVIPHIKKKLNNSDEIAAILDDYQIEKIDTMYIKSEATRRLNEIKKKTILSGQIYDPTQEGELYASQEQLLKDSLSDLGDTRFIKPSDISSKTWKEMFKDLEWDLDVSITNEEKNVQAVMATYNSVLSFLANLGGRPMTPNEKLVFDRLLNTAGGISPVELRQAQNTPSLQPPQPIQNIPSPSGNVVQ